MLQWYKRGTAYHDFEEKYHDFGLFIVKIIIFLFLSLPPNIVFPWQIASP